MSETTISSDNILAVNLTVGQLREILRQEMNRANNAEHTAKDPLLDVKEASQLLGVSEDWLYRNAKKLPFTRKLGPKMLRFSYQAAMKWLATRTPSQ
jgi:predicted DNA-binding transcriptional regulator AlpA